MAVVDWGVPVKLEGECGGAVVTDVDIGVVVVDRIIVVSPQPVNVIAKKTSNMIMATSKLTVITLIRPDITNSLQNAHFYILHHPVNLLSPRHPLGFTHHPPLAKCWVNSLHVV